MSFNPLPITSYTVSSAVGLGRQALFEAMAAGLSGLKRNDFPGCELDTCIGSVDGVETVVLPETLAAFDCRNNRLAYLALQQDGFADAVDELKQRYPASRIGVFLGTSTSGIGRTEQAYRDRDPQTGRLAEFDYLKVHNTFSLADFVQRLFGLDGPAHVVSTACSSSAKVFASAWRQIQAGLCDAAIVGGVDSLCLTTLYGFNSLELVSREPCRPWDRRRNGISIGEGAGFAVLESRPAGAAEIGLLGFGESSDAYHMSSPHPEGKGAAQAMTKALACAQLAPAEIDYVNLHGTATRANDAAEDLAVTAVAGRVRCSSTKGWTGHTLGAAGIIGAATACLCIEQGFLPASLHTTEPDPGLSANILLHNTEARVTNVLVNAFGFGGSNCSLLIGRMD